MRSRLVVSISIVAAVMAGGMLIINGSGASVRAERANTASTPVACPGTTTIGSVVITCSGSGSQEVATVDRPIGCDGCAKGQAQELTITDTRAGGGTGTGHGSTISSVAVSETDGTTASGVVTLVTPGPPGTTGGGEVDITITSTTGQILNGVSGSQMTSTDATLSVRDEDKIRRL